MLTEKEFEVAKLIVNTKGGDNLDIGMYEIAKMTYEQYCIVRWKARKVAEGFGFEPVCVTNPMHEVRIYEDVRQIRVSGTHEIKEYRRQDFLDTWCQVDKTHQLVYFNSFEEEFEPLAK